jgi:short-subunit dehydrogenase
LYWRLKIYKLPFNLQQGANAWGTIDVAINSASMLFTSKSFVMNHKDCMMLMQVNAIAPMLITQAFAQLQQKKVTPGDKIPHCVINISDKFFATLLNIMLLIMHLKLH